MWTKTKVGSSYYCKYGPGDEWTYEFKNNEINAILTVNACDHRLFVADIMIGDCYYNVLNPLNDKFNPEYFSSLKSAQKQTIKQFKGKLKEMMRQIGFWD